MSAMDLLLWSRGPGLAIAVSIFAFGVVLRLFEIYSLGRKADLAKPRVNTKACAGATVWRRMLPDMHILRRSPITYVAGYLFHFGLFVVVFLYAPHIKLIESTLGLSWPALPSALVDLVAVLTLISLVVVLVNRITDPVKRLLSGFEDYLTWAVTLLPVLTGYMAYHHLMFPYQTMLALHILSVELLLVIFPFTKLMHAITLFISRWYNGDIAARKGVQS